MSKRKAKRDALLDLALPELIARGEVEVETVADPSAPNRTLRRAKRVWVPDVMLQKATISRTHHDACVRYLTSYEIGVTGARDWSGVYIDKGGLRGGPGDAQLVSLTDFRRAEGAVGKALSEVLAWCVLGHGSLTGYAHHRGMHHSLATGYFIAALDRLAEHYGD